MIEVKNLVKKYGTHEAVKDLNFTVDTGKVVGFLGPNGAGKSTTMNIITGYIAPTKGTVLIDGVDILEEPEKAKKNIGYLPEIPPLYADMRVWEYLKFVAELKKVPRAKRERELYDIVKKTKIKAVQDRLIKQLSKGYKQRVGLAAALIGNPDILILDEPTVGLDPGQIIEIRELIKELSKNHTVLLSSHIMQEISAVCDEIIIINKGEMITKDTPDNLTKEANEQDIVEMEVKGDKKAVKESLTAIDGVIKIDNVKEKKDGVVSFSLSMSKGRDVRKEIFFAMAERQFPILEMHKLEISLEDAFLRIIKRNSKTPASKKNVKEEK